MKKLIKIVVVVGLLGTLITGTTVYAGTYRFEGQNNYDSTGNCQYGDRPVTQYFSKLGSYLNSSGYSCTGYAYNDVAYENDMTYGKRFVDDANFFAFGGHGIDYSYPEASNNDNDSSLHFYNLNSLYDFHPSNDHSPRWANASWSEIRYGRNIDYCTMWTCNFLHTGGSSSNLNKIFNMFDGMHIMVGFASKMYMNPNEGTSYGSLLKSGYAIKDAWVNATSAYQYQIGSSPTVYASWACHVSHEGDTAINFHSDPSTYAQSPSSYVRRFYTVAN